MPCDFLSERAALHGGRCRDPFWQSRDITCVMCEDVLALVVEATRLGEEVSDRDCDALCVLFVANMSANVAKPLETLPVHLLLYLDLQLAESTRWS